MSIPKNTISKEKLDRFLSYDPETGELKWKISPKPGIKVGSVSGYLLNTGAIAIQIDGVRFLAHRLAFVAMTGAMPTTGVDHINGRRSDNRWVNLRQANQSQNMQNRLANSNSLTKMIGVSRYSKSTRYKKPWNAKIVINDKAVQRMVHDFPALSAFHEKYALGPMAKPSCLCCGHVPEEVAIKHMELPGIVICKKCRDAALLADDKAGWEVAAWQERQEQAPGEFTVWYSCKAPSRRATVDGEHLSLTTGDITYQWRPLYTRPQLQAEETMEQMAERLASKGWQAVVCGACGSEMAVGYPKPQADQPAERMKCDGNHGGPRCADPECWNDESAEQREHGQAVAYMREWWGPDCGPYIEFYRADEMGWWDTKEWKPLYTTPPTPPAGVPDEEKK